MTLIEIEDKTIFSNLFPKGVRWTQNLEKKAEGSPEILDSFFKIKGISEVIRQTYNIVEWKICANESKLAGGSIDKIFGFDLTVGKLDKSFHLRYISEIRHGSRFSFRPGYTSLYLSDNTFPFHSHIFDNCQNIDSCAFTNGKIVFNLKKNESKWAPIEDIKQILITPAQTTFEIVYRGNGNPKITTGKIAQPRLPAFK
jgi:hypothetical protein